jgi:hypothetical protein
MTVDFEDRRIKTYVGLAAVVGGLVLVFYFWATRKTAMGFLLGVAALFRASLATGVAHAALGAGADALNRRSVEVACAEAEHGSFAFDCADGARRYPEEQRRLLELGCKRGAITPCLDLHGLLTGGYTGVYDTLVGQAPSTPPFERARQLCAELPKTATRYRCETFDRAEKEQQR